MSVPRRPSSRHVHTQTAASMNADEPRMISSDEKRELILAHAEARSRRPTQNWGMGYYIGIAASCLVVATGWWLTIGTSLRVRLPTEPDQAAQILKEQTDKLKEEWQKKPSSESWSDAMNVVKQQYKDAIEKEQAAIAASSSASIK